MGASALLWSTRTILTFLPILWFQYVGICVCFGIGPWAASIARRAVGRLCRALFFIAVLCVVFVLSISHRLDFVFVLAPDGSVGGGGGRRPMSRRRWPANHWIDCASSHVSHPLHKSCFLHGTHTSRSTKSVS